MSRLSGSAMVRPRIETPKNTSRAPSPTTDSRWPMLANSPVNSAATPPVRTTAPTMTRCLEP
jgi:hypothetical protein